MYLSGRVHTIMFEDPSQALYIMKMLLDRNAEVDGIESASTMSGAEIVSVKGHVPGPQLRVGSWFGFEAKWTTHPKYGRQLNITSAPLKPRGGWTSETVAKALMAQGVGGGTLELLQWHHGDKLPSALNDVDHVKATKGLDEFTAVYVHSRWQYVQAYFKGLDFLLDLKLPPGLVRRVWSTFGDDAREVLGSNPWLLVQVDGISFQQADEIATRMGLDPKHPGRLNAAVLSACKDHKTMGHLYMTTGQVFEAVQGLVPEATQEGVGQTLVACHKAGTLVMERGIRKGTTAVFEPWFARIERESASLLVERLRNAAYAPGALDTAAYIKKLTNMGPLTSAAAAVPGAALTDVVAAAVEEWQSREQLKLNSKQKQGVINALIQPVSVLTGLPGTGKTTCLKAAVRIMQECGVIFLLCSPTGIASKNLANKTGAPAHTVHRAFMAKGANDEKRGGGYTGIVGDSAGANFSDKDGEWGYGPGAPHPAEVVIIDESSMLDQHLIYRLMVCTSPQTRFVFVGDAAQLPSVGPGNVLRDLINSALFPVVNLNEIFRQKDTSAIIYAAHAIYKGEMPECQPRSDFSLVSVPNDDTALAVILRLSEKLFAKRENFQVLSPRHSGVVGVTSLNSKMRDLLNPANSTLREIRIGEDVVREDDRIMVIRNDYKLGVFNGDVGKVDRIDNKAKVIELKIFGDVTLIVHVPFKDAAHTIRLAYACTVHKCVTGDTWIPTAGGLHQIGMLARGIPDHHFTKDRVVVAGVRGWVQTDQVYAGGVQDVLRFVTRCGFSMGGSHKHPVKIMTPSGQEIWKTLPELVEGDLMVMRKGFGNDAPQLSTHTYSPTVTNRVRSGSYPEHINPELAWLLGVCTGDGNQTDHEDGRVEISQKDEEYRKQLTLSVSRQFNLDVTDTGHSVYFHSRKVREFLMWAGLTYAKGPEKCVPWTIMQSPSDVQFAFLQGLFDTDGGVSKLVHYTTTSPYLAEAVQQILFVNGMVSRRYMLRDAVEEKGWAAAYRVEITGPHDVRLFHEKIGFRHPNKVHALASRVLKLSRSKSNVGIIPHGAALVREIREALRGRGGRSYPEAKILRRLSGVVCGREHLHLSQIPWLLSHIPDLASLCPAGMTLARYHQEGVFLDPVVGIHATREAVYDFHIPDEEHVFIGNGFQHHNCQGLEYDIIIMPVVESFRHQLQRNLLYTAVTRARQRVFLIGSYTALSMAVGNDREDLRNTMLKDRLTAA